MERKSRVGLGAKWSASGFFRRLWHCGCRVRFSFFGLSMDGLGGPVGIVGMEWKVGGAYTDDDLSG
jgi:hypothetical protein